MQNPYYKDSFLSYKFTNRKDKIGEYDIIFFIRRKRKKLFKENKIDIIQGFKSNDKDFSTYLEFLNGETHFSLPAVKEF